MAVDAAVADHVGDGGTAREVGDGIAIARGIDPPRARDAIEPGVSRASCHLLRSGEVLADHRAEHGVVGLLLKVIPIDTSSSPVTTRPSWEMRTPDPISPKRATPRAETSSIR
jgi:hypothetical protein